ncbi:MAG: hypothetical protein B6D37_11105 [Sphingobacteriales bacterium UTBCD1]|jgi:hypothetical protein|nr:MAG: hypothetical protein B6D37_11105 [Sphingobacteriales bacterium UTBCD1]
MIMTESLTLLKKSVPFCSKMARSHHRKKHKHFQPPAHTGDQIKKKRRGASVIAIAGAVVAFVISYSATEGNLIWVIAITVAGAALGYLIGNSLDKSDERK